jgi:hypothetical protein
MSAPTPDAGQRYRSQLLAAVERLRTDVARLSLPFMVPGAEEARQIRELVLEGFDGYVLPRLRSMEAPLLVVIGGSTGAGKSTLTNSLIGTTASPVGVLRPTTRAPVLIHNPRDSKAFLSRRILPGLTRTMADGREGQDPHGHRPVSGDYIRLVPLDSMPPGLAILDSPDLDSLVETNRRLAQQLFGVADLWLFVTTGTDYADATPWGLLAEAIERRLSVAVVLDRMRPTETTEVRRHFATMLRDRGLGSAPVITVPETTLVDGMLPPSVVGPLRGWLINQAADPQAKARHVTRAVGGMLEKSLSQMPDLVEALSGQELADRRLRADLDATFALARDEMLARATDGSALTEAVQLAWRRIAESPDAAPGASRFRRVISGGSRASAMRTEAASATLVDALVTLVRAGMTSALERVGDRWRADPATEDLGEHPELSGSPDHFIAQCAEMFWQWLAEARAWLRADPAAARTPAGADPAVLAITTLAIGADGLWIGPAARAVIEADGPVPDLPLRIHAARVDLRRRLAELVGSEHRRVRGLLDDTGIWSDTGKHLSGSVLAVRELLADLPRTW